MVKVALVSPGKRSPLKYQAKVTGPQDVPTATVKVAGVPRLLVRLCGCDVIAGAAGSMTMTRCTQALLFPQPSITVHVTKLVPKVKLAGALLLTLATPQLSLVTGGPSDTLVALQPSFAPTTKSAGQVIAGAMVSCTVMACEQVALLPLASVA